MKKIVCLFICLINFAFGERPETPEILFESVKFSEISTKSSLCDSIYSSATENIKIKYQATCTYESDYIEYSSPLDPSITFVLSNEFNYPLLTIMLIRNNQTCVDPFGSNEIKGKPGSHQFSEVLFAEMMRLQKYGVILNNKDSLETFLISEIKKMIASERCPDIDFVFYEEKTRIESIIGPGCCSLVDTTTTSFSTAFLQPNIQVFKINKNHLFIQGSKPGVSYSLFDLNGKLLLEGTILHSIIKVPTFPAILRIQNQTLLVK